MEVFVTYKMGLKIFVFIDDMIFAFTTFVTNTPLWGEKSEKIFFKYLTSFLIYYFTFTFYLPLLLRKKMMHKVEISI